jgi:hypothetical protein
VFAIGLINMPISYVCVCVNEEGMIAKKSLLYW